MSAPCNIQNLSVHSIHEQYLRDIATAEKHFYDLKKFSVLYQATLAHTTSHT